MSRVVVGGIKGSFIVDISIDVEKPSTANISSHYAISPLVLRVR